VKVGGARARIEQRDRTLLVEAQRLRRGVSRGKITAENGC
jgi:hypothetical protein